MVRQESKSIYHGSKWMDERMSTQKTIPEVDENEQYKINLEDFNNYSKIQFKK